MVAEQRGDTPWMGAEPNSIQRRDPLSIAHKDAVGSRRAAWCANIEQKERTKDCEQQTVDVSMVSEREAPMIQKVPLERIVEETDVPVPRAMEEILEVETLKSQRFEGESILPADKEPVSKLHGGCAVQAPEWEELRRLRAEELVTIRDINKLLNDCDELILKWLNSVKDVVDSEGLPMNVYRETLLQNRILRVIRKNHVTKYLEMLAEIAELNDDRKKFYERFFKRMKLETAELLRFNTFKPGDEHFSFEECVRMTEEQNDIYYITDESIAVVSSSSFFENLRKKDHEVPYMADPVDEYAVHQPKDFDGTKLNDNDDLELFKETSPSPSLMQLQSDRRGVAHRANLLRSSRVNVEKATSMTDEVVSSFQQEQDDDDNKKTSCLIDIDRGEDADTSPAIDIKSHESTVAGRTEQLTGSEAPKAAAQHRSTQQDNNHHRKQRQHVGQTEGERKEEKGQGGREKGRKDEGGRGQEGKRKEKEREAEVKKHVTDWTVVTRNRRQKKMVQIFVKVNGSRATPMEVNLTDDKVEDVMRQIQKDEDVYVTLNGKVLRRDEKLRSCGVSDGCSQ